MRGFVRNYTRHGVPMLHVSSREWFRCGLTSEDADIPKQVCKGRNCGNYKEVDHDAVTTNI